MIVKRETSEIRGNREADQTGMDDAAFRFMGGPGTVQGLAQIAFMSSRELIRRLIFG